MRDKFKDKGGRLLTQSLFLEINYDTDFAMFTFNDRDKLYKGKTYTSLKKLYLQEEDKHEYVFATTHLDGWNHWQRLLANKVLRKHIDEWREELEVLLISKGLQKVLDLADEGNFQAAKYIADGKWEIRRGRPSKQELARQSKLQERIEEDFNSDFTRTDKIVSLDQARK